MKWTQDEINYLKKNLDKSSNDLSLNLKRNRKSILRKLKSLGLISEYKIKNNFNGKYEDIEKEEIRRKKYPKLVKIIKKVEASEKEVDVVKRELIKDIGVIVVMSWLG